MMTFKQAGLLPPTSAEHQGALSQGVLPNLVVRYVHAAAEDD